MIRSLDTISSIVKEFGSEQEMFSFLFNLVHGTKMYKPEVQVFNPNPLKTTGNFIFPKDTFLIAEGIAIEKAPKTEFQHMIKSMFKEKGVPGIIIVGGNNSMDLKRVTTLVTPKSVCDNTVEMHFIGGFSKEEIRRITMG